MNDLVCWKVKCPAQIQKFSNITICYRSQCPLQIGELIHLHNMADIHLTKNCPLSGSSLQRLIEVPLFFYDNAYFEQKGLS